MVGGNQGDLKGPRLSLLKIIWPGATLPRHFSTLFQTISTWTIIVEHLPNFIFLISSGCCVNGSMTFRLNPFRLKDISSKRHFVEYDISSKFRLKVSKFV